MLDLETNLDDLIKRLPSEKTARVVMWRALNRGATAGSTHAAREVARAYTVKMRKARHSSGIKKANVNTPEATLTFKGRPLNIIHFKVAPGRPQPARRPQLRATIKKSEGAIDLDNAFLANLSGGLRGARRKGPARLPIEGVFGPAVPSMVSTEGVRESILDRMREVVANRLEHEITRELGKVIK